MTTSISSEAFEKIGPLSYLQPEKSTFPPKPDGQTYGRRDGHTDGWKDIRMDINIYRVASLLKRACLETDELFSSYILPYCLRNLKSRFELNMTTL